MTKVGPSSFFNNIMRYAHFFSFIILGTLFLGVIIGAGFIGVHSAEALSAKDIVFPVSDLGNCKNEVACRTYCDDISHANDCIAFAEKYSLMAPDELAEAKKFTQLNEKKGPGGCASKNECETYCENMAHIDECIEFGEKHGLIPEDELKEAKQVAKAMKEGATPPGGCKGKKECQAYCDDGAHIDECLAFAEKAGFIPPKELEEARRIAPLMKSGEMPGGCRNKRECEAFCNDDSHFEECLAFGEKAGFISSKDAEMARKTGGKGPGGCKREECQTYCDDPAHQDECFAFAEEHGLIPPEDLENINRHKEEFKKMLGEAPAEVAQCLTDVLGPDVIEGIKAGTKMPGRDTGDKVKTCFEQFGSFGPKDKDGDGKDFLRNTPPEVASCIAEHVGADGLKNMGKLSQEERQKVESEIRNCFEQFGGMGQREGDERQQMDNNGEERRVPTGAEDRREQETKRGFQEHFNIDGVPMPARDCVKGALNNGGAPSEIGSTIERCIREGMPTFENRGNSQEFKDDENNRGPRVPNDGGSFQVPIMRTDDMMQDGGERFPSQSPEQGMMPTAGGEGMPYNTQENMPYRPYQTIPDTIVPKPIDGNGGAPMMPVVPQIENEMVLPRGDMALPPPPPPEPSPQSYAPSDSLLGNIFMVVNQLLAR